MQYDEGKIYLQDVRTDKIYIYERHLAANKHFRPCVPNPVPSEESTPVETESEQESTSVETESEQESTSVETESEQEPSEGSE